MTSTITAYDATAKKLTFGALKVTGNTAYNPKSGNKYYLTGIKAALDTQKEWWYDSANGQLYLWAPGGGNPASSTVEAKHRVNAFDLSGKGYITVKGIQTVASTIVTNSNTNHILLDSIVSKYISHNKLNTVANEQTNLGIILDGSYNEIRNSELAYSSGSLVTVKGSYNNAINNYIHEGGYIPDWDGLVNLVKVFFATGASNTSATIYFKKTSATGEAYVDDAGITLDTTVYQSMYSSDGFESGLGNWVVIPGKGTSSLSSVQTHAGSNSFIVNEDMDAIQQTFSSSYNKIVSMWFYDNASATNMQVAGFVDDSVNIRGIEVNIPTSTTKYSYRVGGTHTATSITRTTGWHEFKWDYTSGTKVDMYIDGVLIASPAGITNFNQIRIGDLWSGNTNTSYFDDISIQ